MSEYPPCPMCEREAPRPLGPQNYWTCNCSGRPSISFDGGNVSKIIGNVYVLGNRTQCTLRLQKETLVVIVDIRDVLNLTSENIETVWRTNSWNKLKKISSFI